MKTKAVIVVEYDPNWPLEFTKIKDSLAIIRHDVISTPTSQASNLASWPFTKSAVFGKSENTILDISKFDL